MKKYGAMGKRMLCFLFVVIFSMSTPLQLLAVEALPEGYEGSNNYEIDNPEQITEEQMDEILKDNQVFIPEEIEKEENIENEENEENKENEEAAAEDLADIYQDQEQEATAFSALESQTEDTVVLTADITANGRVVNTNRIRASYRTIVSDTISDIAYYVDELKDGETATAVPTENITNSEGEVSWFVDIDAATLETMKLHRIVFTYKGLHKDSTDAVEETSEEEKAAEETTVSSSNFALHKVKRGEKIKDIALIYGESAATLREDNSVGLLGVSKDSLLYISNPVKLEESKYKTIWNDDKIAEYKYMGETIGTEFAYGSINLSNGSLLYTDIDISIKEQASFDISRTFHSKEATVYGYFGWGISSIFDVELIEKDNGKFAVFFDDGRTVDLEGETQYSLLEEMDEDSNLIGYRVKDVQNNFWTFDVEGSLTAMGDRKGTFFTLHYDEEGKLCDLTTRGGKKLEILLDDLGRISSIIKPDKATIRYEYSQSSGCLLRTVNENENATSYEYDAGNRLISSTNPLGQKTISVTYTEDGKVVTYTNAENGKASFAYAETEGKVTTTFTDPKGQVNTYISNALQQTESFQYGDGKSETKTYDKWGNLLKYTDKSGAVYSYSYDAYNHMLTEEKPSNSTTDGDKKTVIIKYSYDADGNLLTETDEKGNLTSYTYDQYFNPKEISYPDGSKVSYEFDDKNRMTKSVTATGAVTTYTYENELSIQVATTTDPNNVVTSNTYDEMGRMLSSVCDGKTTSYTYSKTGKLLKKTNADNTTEEYTYDAADRNISIKDAAGNTVTMSYDGLGHIKELRNADGSTVTYEYDPNGNLIKEVDENKQETVYTYDANDEIKSQKTAGKASVEYERDSLGRVTKETDEEGRTITYQYNALDLITEQKDKLDRVVKYEYDKNGNLLKEIRPDKKQVTYEYDSMDRMTKKVDEKGIIYTYVYNADGLITEKKETSGSSTRSNKYEYDANGNKISEIDFAGNKTLFSYDSFNRLTKVTDALGKSTSYTYGDLGQVIAETDRTGHTKHYTYDGAGNMISLKDANGNVFTYEYDACGRVTKEIKPGNITSGAVYDAAGHLVKQIDCFGKTVTYKYDADGNVTETIDKAGNSSFYTYDFYKNKTSVKDALGRETKYYYNALGWLTKEIDPAGKETTYGYDTMGNILYKQYPDGRKDSIEYDARGNVRKETTKDGIVTTYVYDDFANVLEFSSSNGTSAKYTYDANGKILTQENEKGVKTTFTYDANGNVLTAIETAAGETLSSTSYTYDGNGQPLTITDSLGQITSMEYDGNGNIVKTTTADGKSQVMSYDAFGNLITKTDKAGNMTTYAYNGMGQLVSVTTPEGNVTEMGYDPCGNQSYTKDPLGNVTSYQYDAVGNLIEQTDPRGGKITYKYNRLDIVEEQTNQEGAVTRFTYDDRTNLIKTEYENGTCIVNEYDAKDQVIKTVDIYGIAVINTYDELGNLLSSKEEGRELGDREIKYTYDKFNRLIKKEQEGQEPLCYTYDAKDRVLSESQGSRITRYTYDGLDRVLTSTAPNGVATKYAYDSNNNVVTESINDIVTTFEYDENGNLLSTTSAEGIKTTKRYNKDGRVVAESDGDGNETCYQYDRAGNVVGITDRLGNISRYVYDANGNLTAMTDTNNVTARYEYDVMNRLVKVAEPDKVFVFYKYDKSGNLIEEITCDEELDYSLLTGKSSKKLVKYNYTKTGELLSIVSADTSVEAYEYYNDGSLKKTIYPSGNAKSMEYDAFGNVKAVYLEDVLKAAYSFDTYGQLVAMQDVNGTTSYAYDTLGQISEITSVGRKLSYNYDDLGRLTTLTYPDGRTATYTYDKDSRITEMSEVGGTKVFYEYDANGNVTLESRSDGISTKTVYDKLDRVVTKETFQGKKLETSNTYQYDGAGRISFEKTLDSLGKLEKTYTYTEGGKLKSVKETNLEDNSETVTTYGYDVYGNRDQESVETKLSTTAQAIKKKYTYQYDATDRLKSKSLDGKVVASYDYDKDGNLTKKVEDGHTYTYTYTIDNKMATSSTDGILTSAVTYDGNGLKTFELLRKTYQSTDQVSVDGEIVEKTEKKKVSENSKAIQAWEDYYESDQDTDNWQVEDKSTFANQVVGIDYNKLAVYIANAQLTLAPTLSDQWDTFVLSFVKDILGQIQKYLPAIIPGENQNADEPTRDATKKILSGINKDKYKTIKKKVKNPDSIDEILSLKAYYEPTSYVYDLTQQDAQVLAEYRSTGTTAAETYNYGAMGRTSGEAAGIYLYDGRGSVVETILGAVSAKTPEASVKAARVASAYRYDAYGNITVGAPSQSRVYAYNGEQYTAQTGLIYLRARNYDSATGTFTTRDTYLGNQINPVSRNRYTYGNNNPVGYQDPSGHASIFGAIKSAAKSVASAVTKTVSKVTSTVTKAVTSTVKAVTSTVSNAAKAAVSTVKTAASTVKSTVTKVTNTVKTVATKAASTVVSTAKNVYNTAKTTVTTAVNSVKSVASSAGSTISNTYHSAVSYVADAYDATAAAVSQYVSTKVQQVNAVVSNAWENTKDTLEMGLDCVLTGNQMLAEGIQAVGEWWHSTDVASKLSKTAEEITTAWTNSAIGKTVAAISESVDKASSIIKEKWESSSIGQWCEKTANAISNFYEEHKVLCNIAIGLTIIAACAVAAVVVPGLGCTIFAAMSEEAIKYAALGAISGTVSGAFNGTLEYYKENGTIDGSTSKVLESASDGFMKGTASGAVTGASVGAMKYRKNPTGYCFVAGTVVATVLGFMAIDAIMPGDYVLAKDMDTGIVSYEPVLQTFIREVEETYTITIDGEEIETTAEHPFYVEDEGFVEAQNLEAGDQVETSDGDTAEVESVRKNELDEPVLVYNFEVMDDHTYYVGETGVLVHNQCKTAKSDSKGGNSSANDVYDGVKQASEYLKEQGVPRQYRKQILESFDVRTIKLETAGENTYGLRFYGGNADAEGRYLFETFSPLTNRENLALPFEWNSMTSIQQFQVKNGTTMITGRAASQTSFGTQYVGGANQWYVNNLEDLIKCQ